MGLFNTTKKLSLTLLGLSYLCAGHAADITTIVSGVINTATTDVTRIATDVIKDVTKIDPGVTNIPADAIQIDSGDCGRTFSESSKVFVLVQDMECSGVLDSFALQFSGDNNHVFLNKHSITAVVPEPDRGILITGDDNHLIGAGRVEGFGIILETGGNVIIENASFNHVSGLTLNNGMHGVLIRASDGGSAQANHIYHNHVQGVQHDGIIVLTNDNSSSANANQIYDNHIRNTGYDGIVVVTLGDTNSANANQIHDNHVRSAGLHGIVVLIFDNSSSSSANANQIHNNHIQDGENYSIIVSINNDDNNSADGNQVISNHIFRPTETAIKFSDFTTNNVITHNSTKELGLTSVYCDDTADGVNNWGTNLINGSPEVGYPGLCF